MLTLIPFAGPPITRTISVPVPTKFRALKYVEPTMLIVPLFVSGTVRVSVAPQPVTWSLDEPRPPPERTLAE